MENYKKIKEHLQDLRSELMSYINTHDESQDLTDLFIKVKESDQATYELLMLIYQDFKTTHKVNKKKLVTILDKTIDVKIKTIDALIEDKTASTSTQKPKSTNVPATIDGAISKLISTFTIKNVFKVVLLWMMIVAFLFTLYSYDKDAFSAISEESKQWADKTEKIIDKAKK